MAEIVRNGEVGAAVPIKVTTGDVNRLITGGQNDFLGNATTAVVFKDDQLTRRSSKGDADFFGAVAVQINHLNGRRVSGNRNTVWIAKVKQTRN